MVISKEDTGSIKWIINRLIYKYKEDPKEFHIARSIRAMDKLSEPNLIINNKELDSIIQKYYIDFDFEKDNNIGFTDKEREDFRLIIKGLFVDIVSCLRSKN